MHYLDLLYYLALHKILIFLKSYPASKKGPAANLTKYFFNSCNANIITIEFSFVVLFFLQVLRNE